MLCSRERDRDSRRGGRDEGDDRKRSSKSHRDEGDNMQEEQVSHSICLHVLEEFQLRLLVYVVRNQGRALYHVSQECASFWCL
jgi:hypothetical protein